MPKFKLTIEAGGLARLQDSLIGVNAGAAGILAGCVNATLSGVKEDLTNEVLTVLAAQRSAVDEAITLTEATPQTLSGSVVFAGKSLPLSAFAKGQTEEGVAVQVKVGRPIAVVRGAFYATMRSRGAGVFRRLWRGETTKLKKNIGYGRLPGYYRLPVKQLFSTGVGDVLSDEDRMTRILDKAEESLQEKLAGEINDRIDQI